MLSFLYKFGAVSLLLAFVGAALFGVLVSFSSSEMGHTMSDCPFVKGQATLCPMSLFSHITHWLQTFLAIVPFFIFALLLMLAAAVIIRRDRIPISSSPPRSISRIFSWVPPLQFAFAKGILHPKLYA